LDFKFAAGQLTYHQRMLADDARVDAFRRALDEVVKEGDVVLDIGAGTGILSFLACRAGARHVYAVDAGDVLEVARLLRAANGLEERVTLVNEPSWRVELPEKADVIVSETLWNFGVGEGLLRWAIDGRDRNLKEGGTLIPAELELMAAPLEAPEHYERLEVWAEGYRGIDLSAMRGHAMNNVYTNNVEAEALLAEPQPLASVRLLDAEGPDVSGGASFTASRAGTVHGLCGWFRARLSPGVELTNGPPNPAPSWAQALLPLDRPFDVREGDELVARVRCSGGDRVISWDLAPAGQGGRGPLTQSSFLGFPLGPRQAGQRTPDATPALSKRGQAERHALERLDGSTTVEAIEGELVARFPEVFASRDDAEGFVSDLVRRVAE
jgi:protein arginine N-methyltransferase 1